MYAGVPRTQVESSLDSIYLAADARVTKSEALAPADQHAASTSAAVATSAAAPAVASSADAPAVASSADARAPIESKNVVAEIESARQPIADSAPSAQHVNSCPPPQTLQGSRSDAETTSSSSSALSSTLAPPGTLCVLPDGTAIDLSDVERRLEAASPILSRAVVYHLPGQTYFVCMLALRTQAWQSVPPNVGLSVAGGLSHHLLHEDVVAAIAARGSSAMTTMEAKNDK